MAAGDSDALNRRTSRLFEPQAIAFVGASADGNKASGRRFATLVAGGFSGAIYAVHPTRANVRGIDAYPSLAEIPAPIDLAIIAVASHHVEAVVEQCVARGVAAAIVVSGGFGETGAEGLALERRLVGLMRRGGGRLMGPNCAGLFNADRGINCLGWSVPSGPVALISQSGNMTLSFVQLALETGSGFSAVLTVGNGADLGVVDYVRYFLSHAPSQVILIYLEGLAPGEGRELFNCFWPMRLASP